MKSNLKINGNYATSGSMDINNILIHPSIPEEMHLSSLLNYSREELVLRYQNLLHGKLQLIRNPEFRPDSDDFFLIMVSRPMDSILKLCAPYSALNMVLTDGIQDDYCGYMRQEKIQGSFGLPFANPMMALFVTPCWIEMRDALDHGPRSTSIVMNTNTYRIIPDWCIDLRKLKTLPLLEENQVYVTNNSIEIDDPRFSYICDRHKYNYKQADEMFKSTESMLTYAAYPWLRSRALMLDNVYQLHIAFNIRHNWRSLTSLIKSCSKSFRIVKCDFKKVDKSMSITHCQCCKRVRHGKRCSECSHVHYGVEYDDNDYVIQDVRELGYLTNILIQVLKEKDMYCGTARRCYQRRSGEIIVDKFESTYMVDAFGAREVKVDFYLLMVILLALNSDAGKAGNYSYHLIGKWLLREYAINELLLSHVMGTRGMFTDHKHRSSIPTLFNDLVQSLITKRLIAPTGPNSSLFKSFLNDPKSLFGTYYEDMEPLSTFDPFSKYLTVCVAEKLVPASDLSQNIFQQMKVAYDSMIYNGVMNGRRNSLIPTQFMYVPMHSAIWEDNQFKNWDLSRICIYGKKKIMLDQKNQKNQKNRKNKNKVSSTVDSHVMTCFNIAESRKYINQIAINNDSYDFSYYYK